MENNIAILEAIQTLQMISGSQRDNMLLDFLKSLIEESK